MTLPLIRIAMLLACAALFLVWGFFTGGVAVDYLKIAGDVWSARNHYRQAQGTILVSEVHDAHVRNQSSYWPYIRYEFTPLGTPPGAASGAAATIIGQRYRLGRSSLRSDQALAQRIVAQYPVGSTHVVWYDPADPSTSALELALPHFFWLYVLLLQPFLAAAIGLLFGLVTAVTGWHGSARCLARGFGSGWPIPGWDCLFVHAQDWQIGNRVPKLRIAFTFLSLYAAVCLIAFVVLDGAMATREEAFIAHSAAMVLLMVSGVLAAALLTYLLRNQLRMPFLRIDAQARQLTYTTVAGTITIPLSDIRTWEVRRLQLASRHSLAIFELCVVRTDGTALTVHRLFHERIAGHIITEFNRHTTVGPTRSASI